MKNIEITTLQALADFINANEEWLIDTENIIKQNGWISDCGTEYGICHTDKQILEFNEKGKAIIK